ncbi:alpha/beta hydrolase fold-3 domain-containing protein [Astrocystis sublimbata]|nr:alpha/beta hydrolase fold-3 domain-containing protein [Astrocystis sublimbata]
MATSNGFPLVSYQPFRILFQLSYTATIILRLPYYSLIALIPSLRPHPKWTATQTFMTRLVYPLLDITSRIGITETLTLEPGKEGPRFQIVKPSPLDVYKGLLAKVTKPATIGGTWYPEVPSADITAKIVVLYFHGGAYIEGDGRDKICKPVADRLIAKSGVDAMFSVQYRLSGYKGQNPFPAALQDALSSYLYLLNDLRIPADRIIVAGDSAGGNLTMALLLYLRDFGAAISIPNPKCAALMSPWVAPFHYTMEGNPHRHTDFIPLSYPYWGANCYAGNWPNARTDPYITQLGNPFSTPVPIFVSTGTEEMFYPYHVEWADEMRGIEGNVVELYHEEGAVHDSFLSGPALGFEDSADDVAVQIGKFVSEH